MLPGSLFERLNFYDNPEGWGPPLYLAPERYRQVPYAPFSRLERLGRVADFGSTSTSFVSEGSGAWAADDDGREDDTSRRSRRYPKTTGRDRGRQTTAAHAGLVDDDSTLSTPRSVASGARSVTADGFSMVESSSRDRVGAAPYGAFREQRGVGAGHGGSAGASRGSARRSAASLGRGGAVASAAASAGSAGVAWSNVAAGKSAGATAASLIGTASMGSTTVNPGSFGAPTRDDGLLGPFVDAIPLLTMEGTTQWTLLAEIPFQKLAKLELSVDIGEAETLQQAGAVAFYDKSCDRISCKQPKALASFEQRKRYHPLICEDPLMQPYRDDLEVVSDSTGAPAVKQRILTTGTVLALLMAAPKSGYPWDLIVERKGNLLVIDRRRDSQVDTLTMFETITDNSQRSGLAFAGANLLFALQQAQTNAMEAARINHNFSQAVLRTDLEPFHFAVGNPFAEQGDDLASLAYRYRRWNLSERMELIARCEVDAALETATLASGEGATPALVMLRALNEVPDTSGRGAGFTAGTGSGGDWRSRLDAQRGSVLATELRNHTAKLVRWTVLALMAGADQLKLGFVSRMQPRDPSSHVILGMQAYKPNEFAKQIGVNARNMWAIFQHIVEVCFHLLGDGERAILTKEAHRQALRLYRMPQVLESGEAFMGKR